MTAADLLAALDDTQPWRLDLYQDLRRNPELSIQEMRTAGLVNHRLTQLGFDVQPGIGGTGPVGMLQP